jgi:hypothetical protein
MNMRLLALVVSIGCLSSCVPSRSTQNDDYITLDGNDSRVQSTTGSNYDDYVYANSNPSYSAFASPDYGFGYGMGLGYGYGMGMGFYNPWGPYGLYSPYTYDGFGWGPMGYAGGFYYPWGYYPYYGAGRGYYGGSRYAYLASNASVIQHNNFRTVNRISGNPAIASRPIGTNRFSTLTTPANRLTLRTTNGYNSNDRTATRSTYYRNANTNSQQPTRTYYRPAQTQTQSSPSPSRFSGGGFSGGGGGRIGGGGGGGRRG